MDLPSSQQRPRRYVVGDVINLVMDVAHLIKLTEARAVFTHDTVESVEIALEGEPETYTMSGPLEEGELQRFSFVVMNEEVTVEHVPGVYRISYVEFETASLRTLRLQEAEIDIAEENKKLEIVADPDSLAVSITLDKEQIKPLDHDDRRDLFENLENPDEDEE